MSESTFELLWTGFKSITLELPHNTWVVRVKLVLSDNQESILFAKVFQKPKPNRKLEITPNTINAIDAFASAAYRPCTFQVLVSKFDDDDECVEETIKC